MDKLKKAGVWIVTIAAFLGMQFVANFVGRLVGVPTILDVDPFTTHYGRGAQSEDSSITTTFGWGFSILSVLAAVAVWYLLNGKRGSREDEGFYISWLVGAVILVLGGIPLWKLFRGGGPVLVANMLDLGLTAGACCIGYRIWQTSKPNP
jgi:hypothetical protein